MNLTQLRASRALWLRRERYRRAKWRWYRYKSRRSPADRLRLREKWWGLYEHARNQRVQRDRQIAKALTPSLRARTVAHALTFAGTVEQPANSNKGPHISRWQIDLLGDDGYPWCGCFCGAMLNWAGVKGVNSRIAAVAFIEDDARAHRAPFSRWSDDQRNALPGDLVVIGGRGIHVEIVKKAYPDGSVETVGGNTSPGDGGSQANGGGVWPRHRTKDSIHGIAHVDYPG